METRASFAAIGALALAVAFGAFAFVYWVAGPSKNAELKTYQVIVRGSVDGLTRGSAVQFNGLKVGEVTRLQIDDKDPGLVDLLISIDKKTPVKTDTRVRLEQRLLTGVAIVSLVGATPEAPPLVAKPGETYPQIAAEPSELRNLMENVQRLSTRAGNVLEKLDKLIDENSELAFGLGQEYRDLQQDARRQQRADREPDQGFRRFHAYVEAGRGEVRSSHRERGQDRQGARSEDREEHRRQPRGAFGEHQ